MRIQRPQKRGPVTDYMIARSMVRHWYQEAAYDRFRRRMVVDIPFHQRVERIIANPFPLALHIVMLMENFAQDARAARAAEAAAEAISKVLEGKC
jgi:MoxR-like ATPase